MNKFERRGSRGVSNQKKKNARHRKSASLNVVFSVTELKSSLVRARSSLVGHEELEGLVQLVVDVLRLHLLCDQVRDDGVHPETRGVRLDNDDNLG